MNFDKYTDRSKGFIQSAQGLAVREGHQQFSTEHLLKVLLDDEEGLAAGLIQRAGGRPRDALAAVERALSKRPKVSGSGAGQVYLAQDLARVFDAAEKIAEKAGDKFVTAERLLLAIALEKGGESGKILADAGVTAQALNGAINEIRKGRTADSASAEQSYDALKRYARDLTEAAARRQARSRHRARRGDPPHHPGAVAAHQEQSRADRRARRRQDRDRRGPGAAHRQGRRAREPEGQEAARARHGRADRRREVSRRVRGAPEGRAVRGDGGRGRHHPVHRRDAHHRRRRQVGRLDGCVQPAEAGACPRRAALRRRHHARRVPQARREGRGAGPPLPAGVRQRADGRGHDLDPARPEGEVRAAPRRAHHRQRDRRGGHPVEPLHRRPLPAGQGDRPGRRGRVAAAHAGRLASPRSSTRSTAV